MILLYSVESNGHVGLQTLYDLDRKMCIKRNWGYVDTKAVFGEDRGRAFTMQAYQDDHIHLSNAGSIAFALHIYRVLFNY
jgi:hypothetical protein